MTNIEENKVLNVTFASVFTDKSSLEEFQVPETCIKIQNKKDLPFVV